MKKARVVEELKKDHPDVAGKLSKLEMRAGKPGRRPIGEEQPKLHTAILSIVTPGAGADERRRTEVFNAVRTLDELQSAFQERGFKLSRSATYYRLIPANVVHRDAKRHVYTVPVRLRKPQNDLRKSMLMAISRWPPLIKQVDELASLFPASLVFYSSQDDKARVPLGLPISKKQTAILMHLEYKVSLPDHDFTVGECHKLIPSVYAWKRMMEKWATVVHHSFLSGAQNTIRVAQNPTWRILIL